MVAGLDEHVAALGQSQEADPEDEGEQQQETRRQTAERATPEGYDGSRSTASASRGI